MFSSKSESKQSGGKKSTTYVASPSGGGAMARERPRDQSEASCPSCCLTPAKFFRASAHLIKLLEVALGGVCWYLLWVYGKEYAEQLGLSYDLFQLVNSGASFTAAILLICYSVSCIKGTTYWAVRPSLFEVLFTLTCCVLYFTSSTMLMNSIWATLHFTHFTEPQFFEYHALTAVYVLGFIAGATNLVDCVLVISLMSCFRPRNVDNIA